MKPAVRTLAILTAYLLWQGLCVSDSWARDEAATEDPFSLLSIGPESPQVLKFDIKPVNSARTTVRPGDKLKIDCTPQQQGYLTVLNISSDGNAKVVFPSRSARNTLVNPGQTYTLAGGKGQTRAVVGKAGEKGGTVFYLTPTPLTLGLDVVDGDASVMPATRIGSLARELRDHAKLSGFHRVMLPLEASPGKYYSITFGGVERHPAAKAKVQKMRLMAPRTSEPPESLTGQAGHHQKRSP